MEKSVPTGLYRDKVGWVVVATGSLRTSMPRNAYETKGYEPRYDLLPSELEYRKARKVGR